MARKNRRKSARFKVWLGLAGSLAAALLVTAVSYYYYIVLHPGDHIRREQILARISTESPVFYRDGTTKLGVFFDAEHRLYIAYHDLPKDFVQGIVASEDAKFFQHHGVDFQGIVRAMFNNIKARQVVGGGSTITQQTAKNLYDRTERTWRSKIPELFNALKLEAHYSKEEILEFYVNQFHVYSNGRGIGIAARYFFNKEVSELSTLECAFLAGVVKGPHNYNPFASRIATERDRAQQRAEIRTRYVIRRMRECGYLTRALADDLLKQKLEFHQGDFRFDRNVILDYVYDALQREPFARILTEAGIANPATAGLRIVTTIDLEMQRAAEFGLQHHLTPTGTILEGRGIDAFVGPSFQPRLASLHDIQLNSVLYGAVKESIVEGKEAPSLLVDLGGVVGRVDKGGLRRVAETLIRSQEKNGYSVPPAGAATALLASFPAGARVLCSVVGYFPDGSPRLDLEVVTELQGGVIVLDQGRIRAMVGGQNNRNFNRAVYAHRQLGSTFKPLVYAAALTLGYSPLSPLDNRRQGFLFQNQWYWPRADHDGPKPYLSLANAAATSENLASVSLLYHLTDLLNEEQMNDLVKRVGLAREKTEGLADYILRVRDSYGIIPSDEGLRAGLFDRFKYELQADLQFAGDAEQASNLIHMAYGRGSEAEISRLKKLAKSSERDERLAALARTFVRLEVLMAQAHADVAVLLAGVKPRTADEASRSLFPSLLDRLFNRKEEAAATKDGPADVDGAETSEYYTVENEADFAALDAIRTNFYLEQTGDNVRCIYSLTPDPSWVRATVVQIRELLMRSEAGPDAAYVLENQISPSLVQKIRTEIEHRFGEATAHEKFSANRLLYEPDFRVTAGLLYTIQLAAASGVQNPMKPVLSLVLGSNEISLLEAAMMYQTFLNGKVYSFGGSGADTSIIESIQDASGQPLYEAANVEHSVLDPLAGVNLVRMLKGVFDRGTAAKTAAANPVRLQTAEREKDAELERKGYVLPLMGKTGTTNSHANVAFVGYVPAVAEPTARLTATSALTIASYVGYDDNRPMVRGKFRVVGASGALPAWLETAKGVVRAQELAKWLDTSALTAHQQIPLAWPEAMISIVVDNLSGLPSVNKTPHGEPLGEDTRLFEIVGLNDVSGWRERQGYMPFTPWGEVPLIVVPPEMLKPGELLPPTSESEGETLSEGTNFGEGATPIESPPSEGGAQSIEQPVNSGVTTVSGMTEHKTDSGEGSRTASRATPARPSPTSDSGRTSPPAAVESGEDNAVPEPGVPNP